ncbi:flagellar protein FlgN [Shewanella sp. NKUCC05_KAH]|jgi:flagella synthesis protein FlgN|uniref:Flagellar protein FlgN n=1 Tax=Shewanella oncorhynchi TaxID=2726434 RepID=A0AA50KGD6_9GAMM|nr:MULTISPECIES: flagellar protein FlgN [Shewanella]MBP7662435.1 flagellar protein FlgN [Shewanella sp.]GCF91095.1 flagellar protein FlgN [Shewanella sp. M-Br]MBW3514029.1 flagellar protein FlgN [Shewanella sp. NKUCC01_JLK]MBW3526294.1 flagellar protein FlgN [Shewanella sp. NKUCC05_KAH]MBW3531017.1 flagellar protein FlgN [Shewanella sp. NKUCC06_TVS]
MTEIAKLVDLQHAHLAVLKQIILKEKGALVDQNADLLLSLANEKSQCLKELKTNDDILAKHSDKSLLTQQVELVHKMAEIKDALTECKELNEQNASLIEMNLASLNRFAQALQASRNASSLTYNDKGKTSTISSLGNDLKA